MRLRRVMFGLCGLVVLSTGAARAGYRTGFLDADFMVVRSALSGVKVGPEGLAELDRAKSAWNNKLSEKRYYLSRVQAQLDEALRDIRGKLEYRVRTDRQDTRQRVQLLLDRLN